jgi:predicted ATP-grasp superfamily ATP-dependent carboligase
MDKIKENFKIIFTEHHSFKPNYKIKNGFRIFGADVLLDSKQNPYILEINNRPTVYKSNNIIYFY